MITQPEQISENNIVAQMQKMGYRQSNFPSFKHPCEG